jgi:hypothetical protein
LDAVVHAEKRAPSRVENLITLVAIAIPAVWLGLIVQAYLRRSAEKQESALGISNCRQIITALRSHSADHDGSLPASGSVEESAGSGTSNEHFRMLFKEKVLDKEHIFGCPHSPYVPDGKIGTAPHFEDALKAGENHWMVTKDLSDSPGSTVPFVYENAAAAKWNPVWDADTQCKPGPGRTWSKGIIVGLNDRSVSIQKLAAAKGKEVPLKPISEAGKNLFTLHGSDFEVLDIER